MVQAGLWKGPALTIPAHEPGLAQQQVRHASAAKGVGKPPDDSQRLERLFPGEHGAILQSARQRVQVVLLQSYQHLATADLGQMAHVGGDMRRKMRRDITYAKLHRYVPPAAIRGRPKRVVRCGAARCASWPL